jgi:hypothetical protein
MAIGIDGEIDYGDALIYATQLYAAIANGQSVNAATWSGRWPSSWPVANTSGHISPLATNVDPALVQLVQPPPTLP